jgi:hypothetical protein
MRGVVTTLVPNITPAQVASYLLSKGWEHDGERRGADVWRLSSRARVLVPPSFEYADDAEILHETMQRIAACEDRPLGAVTLDIAEPNVDAQYFRTYPDTPSGTIPLLSGVKATRSIHTLMRSAADTVEKGPHLLVTGHSSSIVNTFLHRVLLGAAAPGSYVLTARVPTGVLLPETLDGSGEFSGRAVVKQLHVAVTAAHRAARVVIERRRIAPESPLAAFSDLLTQGVTANLCQALGDLGGESRDRPFDIGFTWARSEPRNISPEPLRFTAEMPRLLWHAGHALEKLVKSRRASVTGRARELRNRSHGYQAKVEGEVQVDGGELAGRDSLWVTLTPEQNQLALLAYQDPEHVQLEVRGRLSTEHGGLELIAEEFRELR